MVDSYTGLVVLAVVWLGGAMTLAGIGWVIWGDKRLLWPSAIWLLGLGWWIAGLVTGRVLGL